jgi:nucleosome binding factor SPN SPT16 subunit
MSDVKLDSRVFHRRARALLAFWKVFLLLAWLIQQKNKDDAALFGGAESILVIVGQSDEDNPYQKSTSLHVSTLSSI